MAKFIETFKCSLSVEVPVFFFIRRQNKQLMLSFATVPHLLQITALSVGRRRQTNSLNQMIAEENLSSIIQRMKNNTV
jgi:hypothetical protein